MNTILIIEDDKDINEMLQQFLGKNGYQTRSAYSGTEGLLVHDDEVDLIILDLMLPGKSGEDIIRDLKAKNNVPIIVTSAIGDIDKKLDLFELGADDYMIKPFSNDELLARIKVHLKKLKKEENVIKIDEIELNSKTYQVFGRGKEMKLSKIEFSILELLMRNHNQVVTKSTLFDHVWDAYDSADENTLNVHISKIRNKLKQAIPEKDYIKTIWSIGYQFKS